jgi:ABC-2 type transport system ATP-binding protein
VYNANCFFCIGASKMIDLKELRKSYGKTQALDGLSLKVNEGELLSFLGPNGAGKTTTIRILNGLSRLDSGQALIAGVDITRDPLSAKRLCGLVSQHTNLDGDLSVWENLDIHGRLYSLSSHYRRQRAQECLSYVEMNDRASSLVKTLSGGLKRRLMIARALMHSPKLLFLDEPTVGLDAAIRRRIWALIKKINQAGVTIFLTTHYIEEAEYLAQKVAFINAGRLIEANQPSVLVNGLGKWAVDIYSDKEPETIFFNERFQAGKFLESLQGGGTIRRVNLEDAFLSLTGRKVDF